MKPQVRIENWYILYSKVYGEFYGHPKMSEGESNCTSDLIVLDIISNYVETENTRYILGRPRKISETKTNNDQTT